MTDRDMQAAESWLDRIKPCPENTTVRLAERFEQHAAEAVKSERERCVLYAVSWMIANKNTWCMNNTDVIPCVTEILENLSDDKGADR